MFAFQDFHQLGMPLPGLLGEQHIGQFETATRQELAQRGAQLRPQGREIENLLGDARACPYQESEPGFAPVGRPCGNVPQDRRHRLIADVRARLLEPGVVDAQLAGDSRFPKRRIHRSEKRQDEQRAQDHSSTRRTAAVVSHDGVILPGRVLTAEAGRMPRWTRR